MDRLQAHSRACEQILERFRTARLTMRAEPVEQTTTNNTVMMTCNVRSGIPHVNKAAVPTQKVL